MAATAPPPVPSTDTAANCADPANTVADMSTACQAGIPAPTAKTPYDTPNTPTAATTGAAVSTTDLVRTNADTTVRDVVARGSHVDVSPRHRRRRQGVGATKASCH